MKDESIVAGNERLRIYKENVNTGEIHELWLGDYVITSKAELAERKKRMDEKTQMFTRSEARFVWAIYKLSARLFEELKESYVSMLFFLATFCGWNGHLTTGRKDIKKADLPGLLDMSRETVNRFWNAIVKAGIAREDDDGLLYLNEDYFRKGKLTSEMVGELSQQHTAISRLYVSSVRDLYKRATPRSRKTLAYLFLMMPYVNLDYNIVCYNPLEDDLEKIEPMNLNELSKTIGYGEENASRLLSNLLKLKFTVLEKEESAVHGVLSDVNGRREYKLFVSPDVYYAGRNWDEVKVLGKF